MMIAPHTATPTPSNLRAEGRALGVSRLSEEERRYVLESFAEYEIKGYEDLLLYLVSDIFTPLIGFRTGVVPLRKAGVDRFGDLVALSRADLLAIPRIGEVRAAKIEEGLDLLGLSLSAPCPSWRPLPIPFHPRAVVAEPA